MPRHDAVHTRGDHFAIDLAEGHIPVCHFKRVDGGGDVLVAVVHAVAGEMLGTGGNAVFLHTAHDLRQKAAGAIGIIGHGAVVHKRVAAVDVEVTDRRKRPIRADGARFKRGRLAVVIGDRGVVCRTESHHERQRRQCPYHAAAAVFEIRGDERRNVAACEQVFDIAAQLVKSRFVGICDNLPEEKGRARAEIDLLVFAHQHNDGLMNFLLQGHVGELRHACHVHSSISIPLRL